MITTYQIRNVLRIYGNQLKKKAVIANEGTLVKKKHVDVISISGEARQKDVLRKMTDKIVTQLAGNDLRTNEK
ncbi:MAG: hypothetical protein JXL81_12465 [Deltaproteobacteria bacterium]|nr:hypothetical protein [Deltaproteobacteria bacterium]